MGYKPYSEQILIEKLRIRAQMRRMIRKPSDRIADLCDEAADALVNVIRMCENGYSHMEILSYLKGLDK